MAEHPSPPGAQGTPAAPPNRRRRRFLQGGAGAPLVATLASQPVLGATLCQTTSGFNSGNTSTVGKAVQCSGQSPQYWTNNTTWPSPYVAKSQPLSGNVRVGALGNGSIQPATLFHSLAAGFQGSYFGGKTLSEVLQGPDTGKAGVGKWCAAALLNAASGRTPVVNEAKARTLWNEFNNRGYFEPTAGAKWYADDIVRYIKSTLG